jgi:hypothetical protein
MSFRSFLSVVLATLMLTALLYLPAAHASEQPQYTAGDYWVFKTGKGNARVEFVKQEGDVYRFTWNGKPYDKDKHLTTISERAKGYPGAMVKFPIKVGNYWAEDYISDVVKGRDVGMRAKYSIEAFEDVTVPAGTFKAFRIEVQRVTGKRQEPLASHTYWYAPSVKFFVKYGDRELTEYKVK